ncbi:MAG: biotin/lipoyl-binding protein [Clostridia bacterium]|nr:biotin/lipoyl-binding protein [Clostridia bacterium]
MRKIKHKVIVGVVLTLIFVVTGCAQKTNSIDKVEKMSFLGTVEANEVKIASKVPGRIAEVLVKEGEEVKTGQILLKLETTELEAKKKQAEGALLAAQAVYDKAKNGARAQEIQLAKANVQMAEAKAQLLEDTYQRLKNLHEAGAYTTQELQKTETELIAARAQAEQANEQLNLILEGARQEDVSAAQANVLRAQGALDEINNALDEAVIKAPSAGTVNTVVHYQGELIATGTPLFSLTDYQKMWVELNLKDREVTEKQIGDNAEIEFNGNVSPGVVTNISKNPDFAVIKSTNDMTEKDVLTYVVKVILLEPEPFFPGMGVNVTF